MGLESFFHGIRRTAAHVAGLGSNRLELFGIELREELERQTTHLVWLLTALVFGALSLAFGSILALIVFWETHRIAVAAGLMLTYVCLFIFCIFHLHRKIQQAPTPFSTTTEEFRRDRAAILQGSGEK